MVESACVCTLSKLNLHACAHRLRVSPKRLLFPDPQPMKTPRLIICQPPRLCSLKPRLITTSRICLANVDRIRKDGTKLMRIHLRLTDLYRFVDMYLFMDFHIDSYIAPCSSAEEQNLSQKRLSGGVGVIRQIKFDNSLVQRPTVSLYTPLPPLIDRQ